MSTASRCFCLNGAFRFREIASDAFARMKSSKSQNYRPAGHTDTFHKLGWAPTKPMSVLCRKTDTILSVFVGFSLPTQTDTNFFINRHGVGFLSVFCRFSVGFGPRFSTKQGKILIYFGRVYGFWQLKIIKSL